MTGTEIGTLVSAVVAVLGAAAAYLKARAAHGTASDAAGSAGQALTSAGAAQAAATEAANRLAEHLAKVEAEATAGKPVRSTPAAPPPARGGTSKI